MGSNSNTLDFIERNRIQAPLVEARGFWDAIDPLLLFKKQKCQRKPATDEGQTPQGCDGSEEFWFAQCQNVDTATEEKNSGGEETAGQVQLFAHRGAHLHGEDAYHD